MTDIVSVAKAATLAYNEKNWNNLRASVHDTVAYDEYGTGRRAKGVEELLTVLKGWAEATPDSKGSITGTIASGNTVVLELVWHGTQTGPLATPTGTLPPSNRSFEVPACEVLTVTDGKISNFTHYFNMMTLLSQIGAV